MTYIIFVISWLIGGFVSAFTIVPILIVLFFSIPFTMKLNKNGVIKNYKPIYRNLLSILILCLIFIATIWLINKYAHSLIAFIFGTVVVLLFSIGKLGENESNVKEYFQNNEDCLDKQKVDELYQKINPEQN